MRKLALALMMSLALATPAHAETQIAMCTEQKLVHVSPNEVRVYSTMQTEDGNEYLFWQYVATNSYKVGVTYNMTFDCNGNFIDITETEY